MTLHDEYARVTPFELAFPEGPAREALEGGIAEEAAARGVDASDPRELLTLGTVAGVVQALHGPDAPADVVRQYGSLVFHSFRFLREGAALFLLTTSAARHLVEHAPSGRASAPAPAGYLQLPQHLFWTPGAEGAAPESIDGMFWSESRGGLLHVLAVTGVRADRPGFGAVPLPEAPSADAAAWLHADVRPDASDFRGALPGGELDRLYSVETAGELLKLLARFFAYLDSVPHAVESGRPPPERAAGRPAGGPPPSKLAYRRVREVGDARAPE